MSHVLPAVFSRRAVMALLLCVTALLFVLPAAAQDGEWPRVIVDALGQEVTIAAPPQRIASVSLGADEVLLNLVGPQRYVAVTALAQDPSISNVAVLANQVANTIVSAAEELEEIISLEPDLVLVASFTEASIIEQLKGAGLTVFTTGFPVGFEPIRTDVALLGQAVGEEAKAAALVAEMDAEIAEVSAAIGTPETPLRVLYLTPGYYTSGVDSTINEIITAAGGVDVSAEASVTQFAPVTEEFIISANPDVILLSGWTPWDMTFVDTFKANPVFADLAAIQNGRVYVSYEAHLTTVSAYISEGVKDVAAYLYPALYPTFPLTVTDAAGHQVEILLLPDAVLADDVALESTLQSLLSAPVTGETGGQVIFASAPQDGDSVVLLHPGDSPAERVANLLLVGEALGQRVAALDLIAVYGDELEAAAQ